MCEQAGQSFYTRSAGVQPIVSPEIMRFRTQLQFGLWFKIFQNLQERGNKDRYVENRENKGYEDCYGEKQKENTICSIHFYETAIQVLQTPAGLQSNFTGIQ